MSGPKLLADSPSGRLQPFTVVLVEMDRSSVATAPAQLAMPIMKCRLMVMSSAIPVGRGSPAKAICYDTSEVYTSSLKNIGALYLGANAVRLITFMPVVDRSLVRTRGMSMKERSMAFDEAPRYGINLALETARRKVPFEIVRSTDE